MTLSGFPRIAVDPAICGGRPVVAGTRVRVTDILEMLAGGASAAEIVADFPYLTEEDVRAALSYAAAAADHPILPPALCRWLEGRARSACVSISVEGSPRCVPSGLTRSCAEHKQATSQRDAP
eukprot:gene29783-39508_t